MVVEVCHGKTQEVQQGVQARSRSDGVSAGCDENKTVGFAVGRRLAFNAAQSRPALYCEQSGNFHIDTTSLRIAGTTIRL